jgi:hypothetical protein
MAAAAYRSSRQLDELSSLDCIAPERMLEGNFVLANIQ